jgi:hypothetical protein
MRVFERHASREAEIYTEAQTLLDDGFDTAFVLDLFREDAAWLEPMLGIATVVRETIQAEAPSFYFEASLKSRFLSAARERSAPAPAPSRHTAVRASLAGAGVLAGVTMLGVTTFGFITAENAEPGDWNYGLKQTNERLQYALARGNGKVDVQLRQAETRVYELQRQQAKGGLSVADLQRLSDETDELTDLAGRTQFDNIQKERLQALSTSTSKVLDDAQAKKPELAPAVATTRKSVDDAVSAGTGGTTTALPAATPPSDATASPSPSAEPSPSPSPAASATAQAEPSPAASPSATPTPAETPAPTAVAAPEETATPAP